ncbi:MAG: hypothetical protein V2A54_12095 [Bacteroidota bacterium]
MRKVILLLLFLLATALLPDVKLHAQNSEKDSVINDYMMGGLAEKQWDSIKENWRMNVFPKVCKENNLKFSCGHCASIYLRAIIEINSFGMMTRFHLVYQNVCGSDATPKFKMAVMLYFMRIAYPPSLFNTKFQAQFGNGLKC